MVRVPGRNEDDLTKINGAIEQIAQGRLNCTGTVTLRANNVTTTVAAPTVAPGTIVTLSPQTAHAAAAQATTYIKASDVTQGQFIITHANDAQVDKTFGWTAIG